MKMPEFLDIRFEDLEMFCNENKEERERMDMKKIFKEGDKLIVTTGRQRMRWITYTVEKVYSNSINLKRGSE